ncbi:hypothetical protein DFP72DRAFT_1046218 [Ephemerocybe angulata]|uniref:Uncharacterized protein n=1 Tax=Ephemerocybe angulata TaxID=980116 RepID=A0A8H6M3L6_9AGAR|nr:hypothetical protein DFP72DRAFT_1046218 [Tulosesus angulatus]
MVCCPALLPAPSITSWLGLATTMDLSRVLYWVDVSGTRRPGISAMGRRSPYASTLRTPPQKVCPCPGRVHCSPFRYSGDTYPVLVRAEKESLCSGPPMAPGATAAYVIWQNAPRFYSTMDTGSKSGNEEGPRKSSVAIRWVITALFEAHTSQEPWTFVVLEMEGVSERSLVHLRSAPLGFEQLEVEEEGDLRRGVGCGLRHEWLCGCFFQGFVRRKIGEKGTKLMRPWMLKLYAIWVGGASSQCQKRRHFPIGFSFVAVGMRNVEPSVSLLLGWMELDRTLASRGSEELESSNQRTNGFLVAAASSRRPWVQFGQSRDPVREDCRIDAAAKPAIILNYYLFTSVHLLHRLPAYTLQFLVNPAQPTHRDKVQLSGLSALRAHGFCSMQRGGGWKRSRSRHRMLLHRPSSCQLSGGECWGRARPGTERDSLEPRGIGHAPAWESDVFPRVRRARRSTGRRASPSRRLSPFWDFLWRWRGPVFPHPPNVQPGLMLNQIGVPGTEWYPVEPLIREAAIVFLIAITSVNVERASMARTERMESIDGRFSCIASGRRAVEAVQSALGLGDGGGDRGQEHPRCISQSLPGGSRMVGFTRIRFQRLRGFRVEVKRGQLRRLSREQEWVLLSGGKCIYERVCPYISSRILEDA